MTDITINHYSDRELEEFKALILSKLTTARAELETVCASLTNNNPHGTDDTQGLYTSIEDVAANLEKETNHQLAVRLKKFVDQLEAALIRVNNKTYGICRMTGKLIQKERLMAVPHTTHSLEAKLKTTW